MLQKGFLADQTKKDNNRIASRASKLFLYVGAIILIVALIYMAINFASADSIGSMWIPIVIAIVCLIFISFFIGRVGRNNTKSGTHRSRFSR